MCANFQCVEKEDVDRQTDGNVSPDRAQAQFLITIGGTVFLPRVKAREGTETSLQAIFVIAIATSGAKSLFSEKSFGLRFKTSAGLKQKLPLSVHVSRNSITSS